MNQPDTAAPSLRLLLVCSNGGHLGQLHALKPWWSKHQRTWVTFDKADAQHLLAQEQVHWGYYPTTRNLPNLLRNFLLALRLMRRERPDVVVSTGAGVALPFFLLSRLFRSRTVYLEVFDRIDSATLTGRLCRPFTDLFCLQWEQQRAVYPNGVVVGPVLALDSPSAPTDSSPAAEEAVASSQLLAALEPSRPLVVVTAGTDVHRFERLVDWVEHWLTTPVAAGVQVVVQHGTSRAPNGPDCLTVELLPLPVLLELMQRATVVVAQGGPGGILDARACGKLPLVVPRHHGLGEHVDNHQVAFTTRLATEGYILLADSEQKFGELLESALANPATVRLAPPSGSTPRPVGVSRFEAEVKQLLMSHPPQR